MKQYFLILITSIFLSCSKNKKVEVFLMEDNTNTIFYNYEEPVFFSLELIDKNTQTKDSLLQEEIPEEGKYKPLNKAIAIELEKIFIDIWNHRIISDSLAGKNNLRSIREYPKKNPTQEYLIYGKLNLQQGIESILIQKYGREFSDLPGFYNLDLWLLNIKENKLYSGIQLSSISSYWGENNFLTYFYHDIFYDSKSGRKTNYLTNYIPIATIVKNSEYQTRTITYSRYFINKDGFVEFLKD